MTETKMLTYTDSIVSFSLMVVAVGPMILLVGSTPDRIPADVAVEQDDNLKSKELEAAV